ERPGPVRAADGGDEQLEQPLLRVRPHRRLPWALALDARLQVGLAESRADLARGTDREHRRPARPARASARAAEPHGAPAVADRAPLGALYGGPSERARQRPRRLLARRALRRL